MRRSPILGTSFFARSRLFQATIRLLLLAAGTQTLNAVPPVRGRDPWVFRMILENKTRMTVAALRNDLWVAYNPANGTLFKAWSGGINYRGKVYDFSQENSTTQGTVYYQGRNMILRVPSTTSIPAGWTASGVTTGANVWTFTGGNGATMTSPLIDLTRYDNPIFLFYETNGNPLRVQWSNDGGSTWTAQEYNSTRPGVNPQENQKLIVASGSSVRMRFLQQGNYNKTINNISLFGDYRAWSATQNGSAIPVTVDWRGYATQSSEPGENPPNVGSVTLKYDVVLQGGTRVSILEKPEQLPGAALTRQLTVADLPADTVLSLQLDGTGYQEARTVSGAGVLRQAGSEVFLDLTANGVTTLNTTWTP